MKPPTRIAVIMAGGSGERFWPLSRQDRPKQLLNLTGTAPSMLAEAVARLRPIIPEAHVFVVTGKHLEEPIRRAAVGLPRANVVAEPCKRNTAGCLVYAAAVALSRFQRPPRELILAVVTADHRIGDEPRFQGTVAAALAAAESQDALVTIGIRPTRPEPGYGHIEVAEDAVPWPGATPQFPVFPVLGFTEKPDLETARKFAASGRFFWNSGMFFWRVSTFLTELERAQPQMAAAVPRLADALARGADDEAATIFAELPSISVDYALMEQARRVLVVPGSFPWDDIGAWDALDRSLPRDSDGNVAVGSPVLVDTRDCIVYNDCGRERMAVAVIGAKDLIVVATPDGVLVVPKDRAQDVKLAVAELRRRAAKQL